MKLKNNNEVLKFATYFAIITAVGLLFSCSSSKQGDDSLMMLNGVITVIGNEPFAKLALRVDEDVYILECEDDIKDYLMKNQGKLYAIFFNEKKETFDGTTLIVERVNQSQN